GVASCNPPSINRFSWDRQACRKVKNRLVGSISTGRSAIARKRELKMALAHFAENDAGVDSAEAERIAHDIIELRVATAVRNNVEIARRVGILVVDRRRHPLSI